VATISQDGWQRMLEALGPDKAEQWRVQQGIEVETPQALPDAGAETPMGALSQPTTAQNPDSKAGLFALQRELAQTNTEDRDYQRRRFEEGRARLERERTGPSTAEQLFRLSAAFAQPQRYKGFGGMMANVAPVLGDMAAIRERAGTDRAAALEKLQEQYMTGDFAARRQDITGRLGIQKTIAEMEKPKARRTGISPVDGLLYDLDTGEVIPFKQAGANGGANLPVISSPEEARKLAPGTTFRTPDGRIKRVPGGPTQSASGGFPGG